MSLSNRHVGGEDLPGVAALLASRAVPISGGPGVALSSSGLARALWSLGRCCRHLDDNVKDVLLVLASALVPHVPELDPTDAGLVSMALSRHGLQPPELFEALAAESVRRQLDGYQLQDVLRLLQGFAQLGLQPVELLGATEEWIKRKVNAIRPQVGATAPGRARDLHSMTWPSPGVPV